jgi:hypothetical protein
MQAVGRGANFERMNAQTEHQRMAGLASFISFSAHMRAWQGLPLLHPADVVYLTPGDFRSPGGGALPPAKQRRKFREYVAAAAQVGLTPLREAAFASCGRLRRVGPYQGGDPAMVRLADRWARSSPRRDYVYGGREDVRPYEREALCPTRPYGVPCAAQGVSGYWMDVAPDPEQDDAYAWGASE